MRDDPRATAQVLNFERNVFVAGGRFVVKNNPKVKLGYIDERIDKFFGGVDENTPAGELAVHTILKPSRDLEVMVALGLQPKRFIKLGQFYQLIETQGHGQDGPLLVNGSAKVAYVLDD